LAMSDRATPGCLAHQSEAPPGWIQRRDFLEQCSLAKVRSGVRGSRVRAEEQSSRVEIPDRWKAPRFVGSHRPSRGDVGSESWLVCARRAGVSSPFVVPFPRPGCSRANDEEGRSHPCESFAHELSTRAQATPVANGAALYAAEYLRSATGWGPRSPSRMRTERSLGVLARRKRCRSRQAVPGPETRGIDPFLTEHRFPSTGPSGHT